MSYESKEGIYEKHSFFQLALLQEMAAAANFSVHTTELMRPTQYFTYVVPTDISEGYITRIHHRVKDLAGDSYILRLWMADTDGATRPYELQGCKLYESPNACDSDVEYDLILETPIYFRLAKQGKLWFGLEWSSGVTPTTVQGYICVEGVRVV